MDCRCVGIGVEDRVHVMAMLLLEGLVCRGAGLLL